jgi:hypothetical protein
MASERDINVQHNVGSRRNETKQKYVRNDELRIYFFRFLS